MEESSHRLCMRRCLALCLIIFIGKMRLASQKWKLHSRKDRHKFLKISIVSHVRRHQNALPPSIHDAPPDSRQTGWSYKGHTTSRNHNNDVGPDSFVT